MDVSVIPRQKCQKTKYKNVQFNDQQELKINRQCVSMFEFCRRATIDNDADDNDEIKFVLTKKHDFNIFFSYRQTPASKRTQIFRSHFVTLNAW